jgi:crotonobetainyl-CoA:carnitine CoA-transferase CaiB-like acyl-CoA transferase
MHTLQEVGVRAAAVQTGEDLVEHDPELASRNLYFELEHPVIGSARFEGIPIQFSEIGRDNWRSAPLLGEDNEYVLKNIIGLSDAEYQAYAQETAQ